MRVWLLRLISSLAIISFFGTSPAAQSPPAEKPKLKDFGSSLKKLKWDPIKQAVIETASARAKPNGSSDLDVIRVETDLVVFDAQVRDRQGRVITGLTQNDFIVKEDG